MGVTRISCGNCGGAHETVAEVRTCHATVAPTAPTLFDRSEDEGIPDEDWEAPDAFSVPVTLATSGRGGQRQTRTTQPPAGRQPGASPSQARLAGVGSRTGDGGARPNRPPVRPPALAAPADGWAGPEVLGRWFVTTPGGVVPNAWGAAPRFVIDESALRDPEAAMQTLQPFWLARTRVVVELAVALNDEPSETESAQPWDLDPTFVFATDRLRFLVWSNSVDGTGAAPRWRWAELAAVLGGAPEGSPSPAGPSAADSSGPTGEASHVAGPSAAHGSGPTGEASHVAGPSAADGSGAAGEGFSAAGAPATTGGSTTWYDGGPIGEAPGGLLVIHRVALERGNLTPLSRGTCTADLAPDQLAAVSHPAGAARIIAPAGSGKTRVLTERARHLLNVWGLPASALTLVAFNVRAAEEIRERTTDLPALQIRTLNALALAIVNGSGQFRNRGVRRATLNERDVRNILNDLVTFPRKANTDPAQAWIDALALVRLGLRSPASVEAEFDGDVPGFAEVFPRYRAVLHENNTLDFDEQITAAIVALLTEPDTRAVAQQVARVMLVDEFQDLAPAHLLLLRLLASPELALFGVGDDDQTIYGFAGATPEWLIGFAGLFPGAGEHPLEVNYRCPPAVVGAAANLLTHNRRRVAKQIRPRPDRLAEPGALRVVATDDLVAGTVDAVRTRLAPDIDNPTSQIAVLTRVTASLAPIQVALRHAGIPVQNAVDARYVERTGVRSALSWLQVATSPTQLRAKDIDNTARRPSRGISPRVVEWMAECRTHAALAKLSSRITSERDSDKVSAYLHDLGQVAAKAKAGATTAQLLRYVRTSVGLDDAASKLDRSRADAQSSHLDDLDALSALAALHPDPTTFAGWLEAELRAPGDPDGVVLSSIHRVKGREWPHVVIYDVRDGVLPHRLAEDQSEERRVFHVALTRCSQSVTVVCDAARSSTFLAECEHPAAPGTETRSWSGRAESGAGFGGDGRNGSSRNVSPSSSPARPLVIGSGDEALKQALRSWRVQRAKADGVPAYVVFTNVTLEAIAELMPTGVEALRRIPGIGPAKRERYGEAIVDIVQRYLAQTPS
jgi:DNA helicase II / ATP-dependent DNA helicase PcrA